MRAGGSIGYDLVRLWSKLTLVLLVSSFGWGPARLQAHEVTPSIADFRVESGQLTLEIRMNVEAFLAGIDLDGLEDTDASGQSDSYDRFRAMGSAELEPLVREFALAWLPGLTVQAGETVTLSYEGVRIPVIGDVSLPRASRGLLTGSLPDSARSLSLTWPAGAGDLVLRQQGVDAPYTGYLRGGETSPVIPLGGGAAVGPEGLLEGPGSGDLVRIGDEP